MDVNAVIENFKTVVTKHYFDFKGRARRSVFWWYMLVYLLAFVVLYVLALAVPFVGIISALLFLGLLLPTLAIEVRRLHDVGKSGWWILLPILPACLAPIALFMLYSMTIAGVLWLAVLACMILIIFWWAQPGTAGQNTYGADPRAGAK